MPDSVAGHGLAWTVDGNDVIAGAASNSEAVHELMAACGRRIPARHSAFLWGMSAASLCLRAGGGRLAHACNSTDRNVWRIDLDHAAAAPYASSHRLRRDDSAQFSPDGGKSPSIRHVPGTLKSGCATGTARSAVQVTLLGGPPCRGRRAGPLMASASSSTPSLNAPMGHLCRRRGGGRLRRADRRAIVQRRSQLVA